MQKTTSAISDFFFGGPKKQQTPIREEIKVDLNSSQLIEERKPT